MYLYIGIAICLTGFIIFLVFGLKPNLLVKSADTEAAKEQSPADLGIRMNPPQPPVAPGMMAMLDAEGNTPATLLLRARVASPYRQMRFWLNVFFVFASFGFGSAMVFAYAFFFNTMPKMDPNLGPLLGALMVSVVLVIMMLRQLTLLLLDMADLLIDAGLRAKMISEVRMAKPAKEPVAR